MMANTILPINIPYQSLINSQYLNWWIRNHPFLCPRIMSRVMLHERGLFSWVLPLSPFSNFVIVIATLQLLQRNHAWTYFVSCSITEAKIR